MNAALKSSAQRSRSAPFDEAPNQSTENVPQVTSPSVMDGISNVRELQSTTVVKQATTSFGDRNTPGELTQNMYTSNDRQSTSLVARGISNGRAIDSVRAESLLMKEISKGASTTDGGEMEPSHVQRPS